MADDESEFDRLDPQNAEVKLASGFPVEVVRLQTRQMFRLMRIITRGATPAALAQLKFTPDEDEQARAEFGAQLMSIIVTAIPEAEQEAISFLQSMTKPAGIIEKPAAKLNKQESEHNEALFARFGEEMFNPCLEDTLTLLEVIITREAPEIQALGKRLQHLWTVARRSLGTESPEEIPEGQQLHSQGPGPSSSTSSPASTGGATSTSSASPSAGSGRRRRQSSDAAE